VFLGPSRWKFPELFSGIIIVYVVFLICAIKMMNLTPKLVTACDH
jgi:hypothetical protein